MPQRSDNFGGVISDNFAPQVPTTTEEYNANLSGWQAEVSKIGQNPDALMALLTVGLSMQEGQGAGRASLNGMQVLGEIQKYKRDQARKDAGTKLSADKFEQDKQQTGVRNTQVERGLELEAERNQIAARRTSSKTSSKTPESRKNEVAYVKGRNKARLEARKNAELMDEPYNQAKVDAEYFSDFGEVYKREAPWDTATANRAKKEFKAAQNDAEKMRELFKKYSGYGVDFLSAAGVELTDSSGVETPTIPGSVEDQVIEDTAEIKRQKAIRAKSKALAGPKVTSSGGVGLSNPLSFEPGGVLPSGTKGLNR